jgi:glycosyltransferase involved in cell wall biosynthesis
MKKTVTAIMRNEANNIAAWLDFVDVIADEIIINDTGSTDGSQDLVLKNPKVKLIENEWKDNFSLARNQAIAKATGKVILWFDLDDRMDDVSISNLFMCFSKLDFRKNAYAFSIACKVPGCAGFQYFEQLRCFPNKQGIVFNRIVHEGIQDSLINRKIPFYHLERVYVTHLGYGDEVLQYEKAKRNLRLLRMAPENNYYYYNEVGTCYQCMGDYDQALICFNKCYELANISCERERAISLIINLLYAQNKHEEVKKWLSLSNDNTIDKMYYEAQYMVKEKRLNEAMSKFKDILNVPLRIEYLDSFHDQLIIKSKQMIRILEENLTA